MIYHGACGVLLYLQHFLVRGHICIPVFPFPDIRCGELPVLFRLVNPLYKPLFLDFSGYIKEKFQDNYPIIHEILLKTVDIVVALLPDIFVLKVRGICSWSRSSGCTRTTRTSS